MKLGGGEAHVKIRIDAIKRTLIDQRVDKTSEAPPRFMPWCEKENIIGTRSLSKVLKNQVRT